MESRKRMCDGTAKKNANAGAREVYLVTSVDIRKESFGDLCYYLLDVREFDEEEKRLGIGGDSGEGIIECISCSTLKDAMELWETVEKDKKVLKELKALIASIPRRALWKGTSMYDAQPFRTPDGFVVKHALTTFVVFDRDFPKPKF